MRPRAKGMAAAVMACTAMVCSAATVHGGELAVAVGNPPGTGTVVALLFDNAAAFADMRDPLRTLRLPAAEAAVARFDGLAPGRYAVLVFHDENNNGALDLNFMGIPREPLGFSRRYWGRGAPVFADAAIEVAAGASLPVDVELKKIFGRKGLIGVGAGAIVQTSPYRGADTVRVQGIPAITYIGERVQILGPVGQVGLFGGSRLRLAATVRYRLGAYDADDSPYLEGLGDRKDSLFGGLALQGSLPAGLRVSAGYEHDVLDRVGGGFGRLGLRRGFQAGRFSIAPALAVNWFSAELAGHEYGVTAAEARPDRPAWRPGAALTLEPGLGLSTEWAGAWRLVVNGSVEFLGRELRRSPLTARAEILHVFAAVNYTF
jgi:MipA family protein